MMQQSQGKLTQDCANNSSHYLMEQTSGQRQKQSTQSSQNDIFNYDSQQLLTFQNRQVSFASDYQISQIPRQQREISQPNQSYIPSQAQNEQSFIYQNTSMENQLFNESLNQQKKYIDNQQNDKQNINNTSPSVKIQENLFQAYLKDFNNYKESFEQYRNVNKSQSSQKSLIERNKNIIQKQNIGQNQKQITQIERTNQQSPRRFPKILFAHSSERTLQARNRTLTPPSRSPSQSQAAQKPNLSMLEQQNISQKSINLSQSPNKSVISQINNSSINNGTNNTMISENNNSITQLNKPQSYNSLQFNTNSNSNFQEQCDSQRKRINGQKSSNIQKITNKIQYSSEKSQILEQDENILSSNHSLIKNNIHNNIHQSSSINPLNNIIIENNSNQYSRSQINHSNNNKQVSQAQQQQYPQQNQSQQINQYNSQNKIISVPQETVNNIQNKQQIKVINNQIYQTPIKSVIFNKELQHASHQNTKDSTNQSFFSSGVANTEGQGLIKFARSQNGSFTQENERQDNIKKDDIHINSIEYYKIRNEELINILKEKENYINLLREKDNYINEFVNIKNEFFLIKKKLDEKHKDIEEYKSKIIDKTKYIEELQTDNKKLQNNSDIQKKQLQVQSDLVFQLREQLQISKCQNLSQNNEDQNKNNLSEIDSLKKNIQNKDEIIKTLNDKINQSKLQVDELQSELLQTQKENDSLNTQLKFNIQENNQLQLLIEDLQTEIEIKQKEIYEQNKNKQNINQYEQVISRQREDIISLKSNIDEKSRQLSHTLNELQQLLKENTLMTEKYNQAIKELNNKDSELNQFEINHRRELEQLHQSIKNECAQQIINEMQNLTKPLLEENKELQEDLTKEKQKTEILINERSQFQKYEIIAKINDHKSKTQKIQNILDKKTNNFIQGSDEVSKQVIDQLRTENNEMKRTCDIWKAKYKKIQKEMHEVQDQFDEYSKIMKGMKSISSQMQDQSSSLSCSNSQYSSLYQSMQQKNIKDKKQSSPLQNSNYKNISSPTKYDSQTQKLNQGKQLIEYQENDKKHLVSDQNNTLLDTLEGYDLFEQQLKQEILQDINRFQNNLHGQLKEKEINSFTNTNQLQGSTQKQTNRQNDTCNNINNRDLQYSQINRYKNNQPSQRYQQNSFVEIQVDSGHKNNRNTDSFEKPPQNREIANLFGKYHQKQNKQNLGVKFQNENMINTPIKYIKHQSSIQSNDIISSNCTLKSSPERQKIQNESTNSNYINQEIQPDNMMGYNLHGLSNEANNSSSIQQESILSQDIMRKYKKIKSPENKELKLLLQSDDEIEQDRIPNLQNIQFKQKLNNNHIEEEEDKDNYSDEKINIKEHKHTYFTNQNQNKKTISSSQTQKKPNNHQKLDKIITQKNTDEFSFKSPSLTEHEDSTDQNGSDVSPQEFQNPIRENIETQSSKQIQQGEFDQENLSNQRNDSISLTKNSCVSLINNMACIESIQLDQDNIDILKQMKDIDKKIEKERRVYQKYLKKSQKCSSDNERSFEKQQLELGNHQSSNELKNSVHKTSEELTAMLSVFDIQFDNLQKEKLKILNKFKHQEVSKKSLPSNNTNEIQTQDNQFKNKEDLNISQKSISNNIISVSQQKLSSLQKNNESEYEKSNCINNNSNNNDNNNSFEIAELRKRYQKTIKNILGNDKSSNGSKLKQPLNQSPTTNIYQSNHQISNESNFNL